MAAPPFGVWIPLQSMEQDPEVEMCHRMPGAQPQRRLVLSHSSGCVSAPFGHKGRVQSNLWLEGIPEGGTPERLRRAVVVAEPQT